MGALEIDRKDLEDRLAPAFHRRKQIRAHEDVVEVVVEHVEVVEDRRGFREPPCELWRGLRHHRHELPFDRGPAEVAVIVKISRPFLTPSIAGKIG